MPPRNNAPVRVRKGWLSLEFWAAILPLIATTILPDIPEQSIAALWAWAAGRSAQKMFGFVEPDGTRSYQTSEFWISLGYSVVTTVFPDMPVESLNMALTGIIGWVTTRTGIKIRLDRLNFKKGKSVL